MAGGTDLARIPADRWLAQVAWVPQHPHLFATTVAGNIALGQPGARRPEITAAARLAGADDFIRRLPRGYDTVLAEGARDLSAGQRQKIALARAFLRRAPVLLLDEPTAHLDPVSADRVMTAIETQMADRTVVIVTHRPPRSGRGRRTLLLDDGRLTDAGARAARTTGPGWRRRHDHRGGAARSAGATAQAGPAVAGPAAAGGDRGGRRRGVRDRAAGGIRVPAGPRVAASQHPGDLGGRGRGPGAERGTRALPLSRAPGRARCRVPRPGRRQGQHLPAAGTAGPGRAGRVLLRRPARPADLRRRRDTGPVHPGHNPAAGRRAGRRRVGRRLPADSRARRGSARRRPAGRRGRRSGARRRRGARRRAGAWLRPGASWPPRSATSWRARPSCTPTAPRTPRWSR